MSYQVLARKYRPSSFSEVVGQEHVLKALENSISQNKLHQAYIFSGTRGVGKTTICAKIASYFLDQTISTHKNNNIALVNLSNTSPNKISNLFNFGRVLNLNVNSFSTMEDLDKYLLENQSKINNNVLVNQTNGTLYYKNDPINETLTYNTINVPYGKVFNLELSDGTKVYLNSGTSLKYPVNFINDLDREVFIDGEAFFEVNTNKSQFIVSSTNTSAYVYGTKFNFKDYPEDNFSEVILTEGSLGVSETLTNIKNNEILMIKPGEKAKVNYTNGEIKRTRVNTSLYTSWIDGRVAFRNESLPSMIQKLERIYNVVIINNNKDLVEKYFTATILYKEESINDVLSYLSEVYGLSLYTYTSPRDRG